MLAGFDVDPVRRAAGTIRPVTMFRDQSLQTHQAGMPEEVGTYLALFKVGQENTVDAARKQPGKVGLAQGYSGSPDGENGAVVS
jgi:hypothetical protein